MFLSHQYIHLSYDLDGMAEGIGKVITPLWEIFQWGQFRKYAGEEVELVHQFQSLSR